MTFLSLQGYGTSEGVRKGNLKRPHKRTLTPEAPAPKRWTPKELGLRKGPGVHRRWLGPKAVEDAVSDYLNKQGGMWQSRAQYKKNLRLIYEQHYGDKATAHAALGLVYPSEFGHMKDVYETWR